MPLKGGIEGTHLADNLVLNVNQDDLIVLVCGVLHSTTCHIRTLVLKICNTPVHCNRARALAPALIEIFIPGLNHLLRLRTC